MLTCKYCFFKQYHSHLKTSTSLENLVSNSIKNIHKVIHNDNYYIPRVDPLIIKCTRTHTHVCACTCTHSFPHKCVAWVNNYAYSESGYKNQLAILIILHALAISALDVYQLHPLSRLPTTEYGSEGGIRQSLLQRIRTSRLKKWDKYIAFHGCGVIIPSKNANFIQWELFQPNFGIIWWC